MLGRLTANFTFSTDCITGPAKVIDGDTIVVADQLVRLHGIDAPELDQTFWWRGQQLVWARCRWPLRGSRSTTSWATPRERFPAGHLEPRVIEELPRARLRRRAALLCKTSGSRGCQISSRVGGEKARCHIY
jgi:hypothetical protein